MSLSIQPANKVTGGKEARRTQAERTEQSDQRMFDAAIQLIASTGPAETSLTEVGVKAGYSRGLAGHRFGNKDNLFAFMVRRLGEMWLTQLKKSAASLSGLSAVESAIDQHYQFCVDAPEYVRVFYMLWFESINSHSSLADTIKGIHQRRFQDVVNWIVHDPGISDSVKREADSIAAQFSASVVGIVYYWLANPTNIDETKRLHDGLKQSMRQLLTRC